MCWRRSSPPARVSVTLFRPVSPANLPSVTPAQAEVQSLRTQGPLARDGPAAGSLSDWLPIPLFLRRQEGFLNSAAGHPVPAHRVAYRHRIALLPVGRQPFSCLAIVHGFRRVRRSSGAGRSTQPCRWRVFPASLDRVAKAAASNVSDIRPLAEEPRAAHLLSVRSAPCKQRPALHAGPFVYQGTITSRREPPAAARRASPACRLPASGRG